MTPSVKRWMVFVFVLLAFMTIVITCLVVSRATKAFVSDLNKKVAAPHGKPKLPPAVKHIHLGER
ncbi:TPA: hypothetical protein DD449_03650 [Candidatus Berkelbacteria bacterium]|nr:hypothetical protein [Candidatus Berkelbacteria bacterium]